MTPLYHLPADDAPLSEWCRPLSATLTTRRTSYFSDQMGGDSNGTGALTQKLRKLQRKTRNTRIDKDAVRRMLRQGVSTIDISHRIGVNPNSVYRVVKLIEAGDG